MLFVAPDMEIVPNKALSLSLSLLPFLINLYLSLSLSHYGLLWATGFVPAENGGAPEIFKTSWGLDRQ